MHQTSPMPPEDERSLDTIDADKREAMLVLDPTLQMTERRTRCPTHPGDLLREILADGLKLSWPRPRASSASAG